VVDRVDRRHLIGAGQRLDRRLFEKVGVDAQRNQRRRRRFSQALEVALSKYSRDGSPEANKQLATPSVAPSVAIVVPVRISVVTMIIAVMARDAIPNHGAGDRANGTADYAARDSATHKSRLIGHSGTRESKR
jgi:hypothetical protein